MNTAAPHSQCSISSKVEFVCVCVFEGHCLQCVRVGGGFKVSNGAPGPAAMTAGHVYKLVCGLVQPKVSVFMWV